MTEGLALGKNINGFQNAGFAGAVAAVEDIHAGTERKVCTVDVSDPADLQPVQSQPGCGLIINGGHLRQSSPGLCWRLQLLDIAIGL
ncbi:MAG: hypothetical protein Tsb0027_14700 [Wenzhouxiangellaceae bacterium]